MADATPRVFTFRDGANTSSLSNTSKFPVWPIMDDVRVDQDVARRRLGRLALATFTPASDLIVFDGSTNYLSPNVDARVATLGTRFTVEALFKTTSLASTDKYVLGQGAHGALRIYHTTAGAVKVAFEDSANAVTTLTFSGITVNTVCALLLSRDGATLTGILNGTTVTGTVSATNTSNTSTGWLIGADNASGAANFFPGTIDFLRVLSSVEADQRHGWLRLPNPRASNVLFDMICMPDSQGSAYVIDRGPFEMHAATTGSLTTSGTPLAKNPAPVLGMAANLDGTNRQQLYAVVRDCVYPVRVT